MCTVAMLALDALRELLSLYRYVLPAYWRVGFARWWLTWRRYVSDLLSTPPSALHLAGLRDPLTDRRVVPVTDMDGAHACLFSHAEKVADAISAERHA